MFLEVKCHQSHIKELLLPILFIRLRLVLIVIVVECRTKLNRSRQHVLMMFHSSMYLNFFFIFQHLQYGWDLIESFITISVRLLLHNTAHSHRSTYLRSASKIMLHFQIFCSLVVTSLSFFLLVSLVAIPHLCLPMTSAAASTGTSQCFPTKNYDMFFYFHHKFNSPALLGFRIVVF